MALKLTLLNSLVEVVRVVHELCNGAHGRDHHESVGVIEEQFAMLVAQILETVGHVDVL